MKKPEEAMGDMARLRGAVEQSEFDAVVVLSPENVRYMGDVHISTQIGIRDRLALIVWAKGHEPIFIICQVEGDVRQTSWIQDIRCYKEFVTSPVSVLVDVLEELKLAEGSIGIETEYLAAKYYDQLKEALPRLRIGTCEELMARVRMFKTDREVETLKRAFVNTEKALLSTLINIHEGETEIVMANRLAAAMMHAGADQTSFYHINAGPNTGYPHKPQSSYQVKKGDIVKTDCGAWFDNYTSNIGRTAKLGKLTDEDVSYWKKLREIHNTLTDMLRPGNTGGQVFDEATRMHERAGLPFPYAHNGHGIGLQVHERPIVGPYEDIPYEPGMVTTLETRVRWVDKVGYHIEDLFLITEGAPLLLSDYFDNEEILII